MRPLKIALVSETSSAYARGIIEGVARYFHIRPSWSFQLVDPQIIGPALGKWIKHWDGDGIIAKIDTPAIAQALAESGVPTVDVCALRLLPSVPWIGTDNKLVTQLAVEHLAQRGFRHFAYCGDASFSWSRERQDHFIGMVHRIDGTCECLESNPHDCRIIEILTGWLAQLPKPVGIMACNDTFAEKVLGAARLAQLNVPEEVALIGVDNDKFICELSLPPISSVIPNTQATGYQAAALLHKLVSGEGLPDYAHTVTPLGVITRQSSDILAVDDRQIKIAVSYIRDHADQNISVSDVAQAAALSRRVLEHRFKKLLGHTPREEIMQVKLEKVKQLLRDTTLPLYLIAEQTGFEHCEYLSVLFKRETKVTPSHYRNGAQMR